jgi:hypothetical protein
MAVAADGALKATFVADHDGFYRVELDGAGGRASAARPSIRSTS